MATKKEEDTPLSSTDAYDNLDDHEKSPEPHWAVLAISAIFMGLFFGFAIGKGQVFEPQVIVEQFLMRKFIMLKMFLSAVCSGLVVLAVLSKLQGKKLAEARKKKVSGSRGIPATILGGSLLGIGMALCGACPGTVWVQLGSGVIPSSAIALGGAMVASFVWTFTKKWIESTRFYKWGRPADNHLNLDIWLGAPYWLVCLVFAAVLFAGIFVLEYFMPYTKELESLFKEFPSTSSGTFFSDIAWPPYVSGIIVGLLQLPALTLLTTTIGSSGGFSMFTSLMLYPIRDKNEYVMSRISDKVNYFQPLYLLAAVLGGVGAAASSSSLHFNQGLSPALSFFGGFFILFGSLMGGGCTSGHGISGMQTLAIPSMVATAAMFGGGIVAAYVMWAAGAYGNSLDGWPFTV